MVYIRICVRTKLIRVSYIYIYIHTYITEVFWARALGPYPDTDGSTPHFSRPGATENRTRFRVPISNRQNEACIPTFMKTRPKQDPKVTPKPLKWTWADLSKHVVFIVFEALWNTWEGVGIQFVFCLLSRRVLFEFIVTVIEI